MSWLSDVLKRYSIIRELRDLAYFVVWERYVSSIVAAYDEDPGLAALTSAQKRAAASIALEVVRRKLLGN